VDNVTLLQARFDGIINKNIKWLSPIGDSHFFFICESIQEKLIEKDQ